MANLPKKATVRRGVASIPRPKALMAVLPLRGGSPQALDGLTLPDGASLAVVSADVAILERMRLSSGIRRFGVLRTMRPSEPDDAEAPTGVEEQAFEPSPRAVAVLRGRRLAADDLRLAGGAFTLDEVRTVMGGVSRQVVVRRVQDGTLLSVKGPNNRHRFPTFQFDVDGTPVHGLDRVREALRTRNDWTLLNFLAHPDHRLGGRIPIEVLKEGALDEVLGSARCVGSQ